jgi:ankyrin repeat protein
MNTFIQTCTLDEAKLVLNDTNLSTRCHPDLSLLHVAAIAGNIPVAKYLLEKGLDVEDSTCFELTPVYMAAINGKTEMVRYLVEEHRANIHTKNMFGETILDAINHQKHPQRSDIYKNYGSSGETRGISWSVIRRSVTRPWSG